MSKDEVQNYWDQAEEGAAEESGGGVIGKAKIELGYWVYVSGLTGNDRAKCLFIPKTPDKAGRQAAKVAAYAFAAENGVEKRSAPWAAITRLYKDECVSNGDPVAWEADRFEVVPLWTLNLTARQSNISDKGDPTASAAKLVMDAIKEHGVPAAKDFYGRFGWLPDPYKASLGKEGMTAEDKEGNPKFPTICTVLEKYANKAAALEAIAGQADNDESSTTSKYGSEFPGEGWEDTDWAEEVKEIETALMAGVDDLATYADDEFGKDTTWLVRAMDAGGLADKAISKLTGLKRGAVRKALAVS